MIPPSRRNGGLSASTAVDESAFLIQRHLKDNFGYLFITRLFNGSSRMREDDGAIRENNSDSTTSAREHLQGNICISSRQSIKADGGN